jgi:hypothetical protein
MPVVIVRPDNFLDPSGARQRILHAADMQDLLDCAIQAYRLVLPSQVEPQFWSHPLGYNHRRQLSMEEPIDHDGITVYLKLKVHPDPSAPGRDGAEGVP